MHIAFIISKNTTMKIKTLIALLLLTLSTTAFTGMQGWYTLETKSYKIVFPKTPTPSSQDIDSDIGKLTLNLHIYEVPENVNDSNQLYLLNETAYPDSLINSGKKEILESFFKNAIAGSVKNVQGKVLAEKNIELSGYPGREISVDYQNGSYVIKMRIYLVKNIVYMLQTISETQKQSNSSAARFFNSFQLRF